jgi:hypothetical protein
MSGDTSAARADSWDDVRRLRAASEKARDAGKGELAKDLEQQAEAMRRRLEKGNGR